MSELSTARAEKGLVIPVLAVVLVVLAFVGTTSIVLFRSRTIGEAAQAITNNAVPSIEQLLGARSDVVLLRVRIEAQLGTGPAEPEGRALVWATVRQLRQRISGYVSLPSYPGEQESWGDLLASIDALVDSLEPMLAARKAGDLELARRLFEEEFEPASVRVETLLADNERVNAEQVKAFAERMELLRETSRRDALALNGLCVLLAATLAAWVIRSTRRYQELQGSYVRQSEARADEMEVFAGRVAHDILSPLSSAMLALDLLGRSGDAEVARLAKRGAGGVTRVRSTVDGLLEFARAGARASEEVSDVAEVSRSVVDGMQEQALTAGVSLELGVEGRRPMVLASAGVLTSIVTNLVQNAIRYIGEGPAKQVSVGVEGRNGVIRVEVRDTGPGLPPGTEDRVFEPYFRARSDIPAGLGLGLATVKRLVVAHGGRLGVNSRSGRGSTFWFELPTCPPPEDRA